jgi:hypothetical protein
MTTIMDLIARVDELDAEDVIFAKPEWTENAEADRRASIALGSSCRLNWRCRRRDNTSTPGSARKTLSGSLDEHWPRVALLRGSMSIRLEVRSLVALGPFPASRDADEDDIDRRDALLTSIAAPVTREEAAALLGCFGPDDAFGLAWALLHLIESAPGGAPLTSEPAGSENEWLRRLRDRAHRSS